MDRTGESDEEAVALRPDAVLVSLMRDVSQTHLVHSACQQLSTLGIRVFGAEPEGASRTGISEGSKRPACMSSRQIRVKSNPASSAMTNCPVGSEATMCTCGPS